MWNQDEPVVKLGPKSTAWMCWHRSMHCGKSLISAILAFVSCICKDKFASCSRVSNIMQLAIVESSCYARGVMQAQSHCRNQWPAIELYLRCPCYLRIVDVSLCDTTAGQSGRVYMWTGRVSRTSGRTRSPGSPGVTPAVGDVDHNSANKVQHMQVVLFIAMAYYMACVSY
jgi:hypothetical protein